jgi:hypothetical protein
MIRRWQGLAAILMATAAALSGCSPLPPGVAVPPTLAPAKPLPTIDGTDSRRGQGNWNLVHRVDVPQGWTLSQVQVSGNAELSSWRRVGDEAHALCGVSVWGDFADFTPQPGGGEPVEVRGRPGLFLGKPDGSEGLSGLWWHYRRDAWASLDCEDSLSRDEILALADRVTFRPTQVLLPFRLRSVPEGYAVGHLGWEQVTSPPTFTLSLRNLREDEFPQAPQVTMVRMTGATPPSRRAVRLTVAGRAAVLDPLARTLCFPVDGWRACVDGGFDSDPPEPAGEARLQDRLMAVGSVLDLAPDLDDPAGWFDGNAAAGG